MPAVNREPPYLQVARALREQILSGELAEGNTFPSARKIAQDFGLAHATAARVIKTLQDEGLVASRPGAGTVVTRNSLHRSAQDRLTAITRTGLIYPEGHYAVIRSAELVPGPGYVVEALGLEPDSAVIRRQRTTYNPDEAPESTSISWFDGALTENCPDLLVAERIRRGTINYIADRTGRALRHGRDGVAAGRATDEIAAELRVEPGAPVLLGRNWWTDSAGWVAEFGESIAPEGRWVHYDYEIGSE
ncbi:GntR family transcriptional regulator [Kutzneria buriramensis]|uniref:DNA-binding GntR family transcriptional regulator n=1 Tax=Kutzneria buriramensis TaxID=1045776 RepID=A0A3E0G764_9PSEU|nr:GntR family transcriptional regulator [Kutzneria buriramensis]REH18067.1 DNA-binding GntR family transcriptional regulator [Kutzneria buriramensis]